jgi:hypothetical protein
VAKDNLLAQIQDLDTRANASGLDEEGWAYRYYLEDQLMQILSSEEEYWKQRGRQNWLLKGDANMAYFHAIDNMRRHKCVIFSLQAEQGLILEVHDIQAHIYEFYMALMGSEEPKFLSLAPKCWP